MPQMNIIVLVMSLWCTVGTANKSTLTSCCRATGSQIMEIFPAHQGMPFCGNCPLGLAFDASHSNRFSLWYLRCHSQAGPCSVLFLAFPLTQGQGSWLFFSVLCYLRIAEWLGLIITNILADLVFKTIQQHFIKYLISLEIQKDFKAVNIFFCLFATAFLRKRSHFCLNALKKKSYF